MTVDGGSTGNREGRVLDVPAFLRLFQLRGPQITWFLGGPRPETFAAVVAAKVRGIGEDDGACGLGSALRGEGRERLKSMS